MSKQKYPARLTLVPGPLRMSSLLNSLFSAKELHELRMSATTADEIWSHLREHPDAILAGSYFESADFLQIAQIAAKDSAQLTAQVSFGSELFLNKENIIRFLELGHHLQIWFENPQDLHVVDSVFSNYEHLLSKVFVVSKKFEFEAILPDVKRTDLFFLPVPKKTYLDSFLDLEEIHIFSQKVGEGLPFRTLYLPEIFKGKSPELSRYYQDFSDEQFRLLLLRKKPLSFAVYKIFAFFQFLRFFTLIDTSRNLLLFLSRPSREGFTAIFHNLTGALGGLYDRSIRAYWKIYSGLSHLKNSVKGFFWKIFPVFGEIRVKGLRFFINSYWRGFSVFGTLRVFVIRAYWGIYGFIRAPKVYIIRLYWRLLAAWGRFWAFSIRTYWAGYALVHAPKIYFIRAYWRMYSSVGEIRVLGIRSYWRLYGLAQAPKIFLIRSYWRARSLFGMLRALMVRTYWLAYTAVRAPKIFFIRLYWRLFSYVGALRLLVIRSYWLIRALPGTFWALMVRAYWGGYKVATAPKIFFISFYWRFFSAVGSARVSIIRFYWWTYTAIAPVRFVSVKAYWWLYSVTGRARVVFIRIYYFFYGMIPVIKTVFWPARKAYWFTSYQWRTRLLPLVKNHSG